MANIIMLTPDQWAVEGKGGPFPSVLEVFSRFWDRIDLLCPKPARVAVTSLHGNCFFHPLEGPKWQRPRRIVATVEALLRERTYHLVISHDYGWFLHGLAALKLQQRHGLPFVSEYHVGLPAGSLLGSLFWEGVLREDIVEKHFFRWYLRLVRDRVLALRVVNRDEAAAMVRSWGFPNDKILVIPSFYLDFGIFRDLGLPKKYDVMYCGRLVRHKGILLFLEAVAELNLRRPGVTAAVIGEGEMREEAGRRARELGLEKQVAFLGWFKELPALAAAYNEARVFVMTSCYEGGPRTALEAMACGVPVVSGRAGVMREVLHEGVNGYWAEWTPASFAHGMEWLLLNEEKRRKAGEAAQESVAKFERFKMIGEYARTYRNLLGIPG